MNYSQLLGTEALDAFCDAAGVAHGSSYAEVFTALVNTVEELRRSPLAPMNVTVKWEEPEIRYLANNFLIAQQHVLEAMMRAGPPLDREMIAKIGKRTREKLELDSKLEDENLREILRKLGPEEEPREAAIDTPIDPAKPN